MVSTKSHSELNLAREKRRLFTAFLAMLALLFSAFAVIGGAFYSARYDESVNGTRKIVANVVEANKADLAMELFVNQTAAFDLRLQNLKDKLASVISKPELCLFDSQATIVASTFSRCDVLGEGDSGFISHPIIEAEAKVGEIRVQYRNPFAFSAFVYDYRWHIAVIVAGFFIALLALIGFFKKYMGHVFDRVSEYERHASMGQTAHMLAHDIQTPLNVLQHGLNIIGDSDDAGKIKKVAATTLPAVEKAKLQIQNMLADLREVGAGGELEIEDVSLNDLISESVEDLSVLFDDLDIEFKYDLQHKHYLKGDKHKLGRVFGNILVNAVHAMESEGTITFSSRDVSQGGDAFIEITIHNTGSFIPKEKMDVLFDSGYSSGKKDGNGLGLAIVKKIVKQHGGEVRCSSSESSGTSFSISIPRGAAARNMTPELPHHGASAESNDRRSNACVENAEGLRVLIVDDDPFFLNAVTETISSPRIGLSKKYRLDVVHARDSKGVFRHVSEAQPDIIFLDINLGKNSLNGHQILKKLREDGVTSLVVMNTNSGSRSDNDLSDRLGADAHFQKPLRRVDLLEIFEKHGIVY